MSRPGSNPCGLAGLRHKIGDYRLRGAVDLGWPDGNVKGNMVGEKDGVEKTGREIFRSAAEG